MSAPSEDKPLPDSGAFGENKPQAKPKFNAFGFLGGYECPYCGGPLKERDTLYIRSDREEPCSKATTASTISKYNTFASKPESAFSRLKKPTVSPVCPLENVLYSNIVAEGVAYA